MTPSRLARVVIVLHEPHDQVNIAATIRAMANMGVSTLRLVQPVDYDPNLIEVVAHDTRTLVERIEHFETLDRALADCSDVVAFTARRRAAKRVVLTPREAAARLLERASEDTPVALLFGREDAGLPNAALDRAHALATIPTTAHPSLNLAQAVMVALYELHLAAGDATRTLAPPRHAAPPATSEQFEQLFTDAERALVAIDFFKTRFAEHVVRSLRSLTFRAEPDSREITLLRAIAIEVLRGLDRKAIIPRDR